MQSCGALLQFKTTNETFDTGAIMFRNNQWTEDVIEGRAILFDETNLSAVKEDFIAFVQYDDKPTDDLIRSVVSVNPKAIVLQGLRSAGWGQYRAVGDTDDITIPTVEVSFDDFKTIAKAIHKGSELIATLEQDHENIWTGYFHSILYLLFFTLLPILHNVVNLVLVFLVFRRVKARKKSVCNVLGLILLLQIFASLCRIIHFLDPNGVHGIITYRANDIVASIFLPFMLSALILSLLYWRENFKAKKLLIHSLASSLHPFIYIAAVSIFPIEIMTIILRAIGIWSETAQTVWICCYGGIFAIFGLLYQLTAYQAWSNYNALVKLNRASWGCVTASRLVFFVIIGLVLQFQLVVALIWTFSNADYYPLSYLAVSGIVLYLVTTECTLQLLSHLIKRRAKTRKLSNLANSTQTDSHAMADMTLSGNAAESSESYSPSIDDSFTKSHKSISSSDLLSASTSSTQQKKSVD